MKPAKEHDYEYCQHIECRYLTDDETCSRERDPIECAGKALTIAEDDKYYWDIQKEREKREAELE